MERKVKLLTPNSSISFKEIDWVKPEITPYEIEVKAVMTGVCRSDIDMMRGWFKLPIEMHGHEGLGIVTQVGSAIHDVAVGDFVATRGEPAYADFYNAGFETYVKVPELSPKYIIEPIACGINIFHEMILRSDPFESRICIIGTGFLSHIVYTNLVLRGITNINVVGRHNADFWVDEHRVVIQDEPEGKYDIVVDLSNNNISLTRDMYNPNALLVFASSKHPTVASTFDHLLWNAVVMACPSPRSRNFHSCMLEAVSQIETGKLNVDNFWTKGYNRNTDEWRLAFIDSLTRPPGFNRAYIYW